MGRRKKEPDAIKEIHPDSFSGLPTTQLPSANITVICLSCENRLSVAKRGKEYLVAACAVCYESVKNLGIEIGSRQHEQSDQPDLFAR